MNHRPHNHLLAKKYIWMLFSCVILKRMCWFQILVSHGRCFAIFASFDGDKKLLLIKFLSANICIFEQADLIKPESIPATLVGVHTVIDCATGRPEEPIKTVSFVLKIWFISFFLAGNILTTGEVWAVTCCSIFLKHVNFYICHFFSC